MIFKVTL